MTVEALFGRNARYTATHHVEGLTKLILLIKIENIQKTISITLNTSLTDTISNILLHFIHKYYQNYNYILYTLYYHKYNRISLVFYTLVILNISYDKNIKTIELLFCEDTLSGEVAISLGKWNPLIKNIPFLLEYLGDSCGNNHFKALEISRPFDTQLDKNGGFV